MLHFRLHQLTILKISLLSFTPTSS